MINYSVIIPHYNRPLLLDRCLASIPQRKDIEIIVVDDNSQSEDFNYDNYWNQKRAENIKVILTHEGKGAGFARNKGLQIASGKWLIFADSDDYFLQNAFNAFDCYVDSDYDIVYFATDSKYSDSYDSSDRNKPYNSLIEGFFNEGETGEIRLRLYFGPPWAKMVRKDLVKNPNKNNIDVKFDEVKHSNDIMFSTKIGFLAKKICADRQKVYCITVAYGSLVNTMNYKALKQRFEIFLSQNDFFLEHNLQEYQRPVMAFLRKGLKYGGIKGLFEFISMAKSHNCQIFRGWEKWFRAIPAVFFKSDKKKKYIKYE